MLAESKINENVCRFRPYRLHSVHRCGLLLQMSHVAWYTCLFVCVLVHGLKLVIALKYRTCISVRKYRRNHSNKDLIRIMENILNISKFNERLRENSQNFDKVQQKKKEYFSTVTVFGHSTLCLRNASNNNKKISSDELSPLCKSCYYHLRKLRRIPPYFHSKTTSTIATSNSITLFTVTFLQV